MTSSMHNLEKIGMKIHTLLVTSCFHSYFTCLTEFHEGPTLYHIPKCQFLADWAERSQSRGQFCVDRLKSVESFNQVRLNVLKVDKAQLKVYSNRLTNNMFTLRTHSELFLDNALNLSRWWYSFLQVNVFVM